jgi:hypothetical protein
MADYSQVNDYSAKDALATGDPLKLIKGSDIDAEFSAVSTAIESKFDSTDIATAGEAQAGVSNTVVITPARLTAWGQNDAGIIEDLQALSDPNADRVLFWDDSAGTTTFLTVGTGLDLTATTLTVDEAALTRNVIAGAGLTGGGVLSADRTFDVVGGTGITVNADDIEIDYTTADHDAFLNFVADEHVAHSGVTLTAGVGLTGGGTIAASRTFDLDVSGLTEELTVDAVNDSIVFYDNSAATHRKVPIDTLVGTALGDGKWYRNATQAITAATDTTIAFNAADYDQASKGTFNTGTGEFTASSACRLLVTAQVRVTGQTSDSDVEIKIQKNGSNVSNGITHFDNAGTTADSITSTSTVVSLSSSDVIRVQVNCSDAETVAAGTSGTSISIVELA